jgi:glycosyltransferase involved in cell wall biosynthesis
MSEPRPLRAMRILTRPNLGGPTRQAIALWHALRAVGVPTLLATGAVERGEAELSPASQGVPELSWAEALERGREATGWVVVPHLGRGVSPLGDLRARRALRRLMASHRPDVVHTHTSKAGWLGRAAAFAARVPVVAHTFPGHVLQDYFSAFRSRWLKALERRLARRTDLLFAVSPSCADELAGERVATRDRLRVLRPAVPLEVPLGREQARSELGIGDGEFRIVCAGRLVAIKRVEDFVDVLGQRGDWSGDVAGAGPLRGELEALGRRVGARVRWLGAVPGIARMLAAYDVLVLPSVREGCPLIAVEAFAAGVPVVGYDVPGVRDVLAVWGKGVLVPPVDGPRGLAAAIESLRRDPDLAAACVAAGRAAVPAFAPGEAAMALAGAYSEAHGAKVRYHPPPAG